MDFRRIRDEQELTVDFQDFPELFCSLLGNLGKAYTAQLETLSETKSVFTVL